MKTYTNVNEIPLSMAVFLVTDDYDGESPEEFTISVTTLLKSTRQIILGKRLEGDSLIDISGLIASRMGSAYHKAIEQAWLTNHTKALQSLGTPNKVVNKIVINPTKINDGDIPVYLEQRVEKKYGRWTITGKYDLIINGTLEDIKSTKAFTYMKQTNKDKYALQGSLYRWLNPDKITDSSMRINYLFTDWDVNKSKADPNYPRLPIVSQKIPLIDAEAFLKNKIRELDKHYDSPETDLPPCTDSELWRDNPTWKYYANPESTKSQKNFDNEFDAKRHLAEKRKGVVRHVPGKVKACLYCSAFTICTQKDYLIETGELVI